ncbi:helix-turn-helix domain-containing protein [Ghiorsea bivora]|uniref:helix-turn-helix domain-containing protein n=1 Tax=Ghiorsea bivora TaxID=1485545 RepID=UPI0006894246|nr:helix-turn-helix domain-containing protein [Ghiorsea bivora]
MAYKISTATQLSDILKSKRKSLGLTQEKMGKKLGVSQRVYARNEAHPEKVNFGRIVDILAELDMDLIVRERHTDGDDIATDTESW